MREAELPASLSIVIPTLNAARFLPATLAAIGDRHEVVIADSGSTDGTQDLAAGARVLSGPPGRGAQIAAGIAAATGSWVLILHADTRLSPGWEGAVADHRRTRPGRAGYFRFRLESDDPRARRLERAVAWRCRVLALPYGDQGLLISKALLAEAGGVRPLPLMEDVDLVRRLGRDRLAPLDADAVTSPARWERDGWYRRSGRNVTLLGLWYAGLSPARIAKLYS
jgi:rSAM/selenodomain-associated transferase 2